MQRSMRVLWVLAAIAAPAFADNKPKPKPIKAQFLCGTFVGGAIKEPITGGKRGKLTDPIACALHIDNPKEPSHMATIRTIRYPANAKKVSTSGSTEDIDHDKDLELVMKSGVADGNGEVLFNPCEDFDIVAKVSDDLGVYFEKTIKVQPVCPKPKPIAAAISCVYEAQDGTVFKWPGNGAKVKPRLSSSNDLACQIGGKVSLGNEALTGSLAVKGKPAKTAGTRPLPDKSWAAELAFSPGDFDECDTITLVGSLTDASNATRWSGSLKIIQSCPD